MIFGENPTPVETIIRPMKTIKIKQNDLHNLQQEVSKQNELLYKQNWKYAQKIQEIIYNFPPRSKYFGSNDGDFWFTDTNGKTTLFNIMKTRKSIGRNIIRLYINNYPIKKSKNGEISVYQHEDIEDKKTGIEVIIYKSGKILVNGNPFSAKKVGILLKKIEDNVKQYLEFGKRKQEEEENNKILNSINY